MVLEVDGELLSDDGLDDGLDLGVAELALGLPLELGVDHLHGEDGGQALTNVLALEVVLVVLDQLLLAAEVVQGAGEGGAVTGDVGAALDGGDAVDEGRGLLAHVGGVLHGEVDLGGARRLGDGDDIVEGLTALVELADHLLDAALEAVLHPLADDLVLEVDLEAGVQVGHLLEALGEDVKVEGGGGEDLAVREEADGGAAGGGLADLRQGLDGLAAVEILVVAVAVPLDLDPEPLAEEVHDGCADAVEAAGHLVAAAAELAAGVQLGEDRFDGGHAGSGVRLDGHAAAVVLDLHGAVGQHGDDNLVAVAGHGLVDGVVDDLVDEVMEAALVCAANVHTGPKAHGLKAL